jgi:hypothetical protein
MSARKRINKTKFYAINRDLKAGGKVQQIAAVQNVSEETVRTVRRAKTWPRFEAMKKLKNEKRRPTVTKAPAKAVLVQQSLSPDVAQLDEITQAPDNQIRPVPSEEIKVVTVAEWEGVQRKLGLLYSRMDVVRGEQLRRKPLLSIFGRTK